MLCRQLFSRWYEKVTMDNTRWRFPTTVYRPIHSKPSTKSEMKDLIFVCSWSEYDYSGAILVLWNYKNSGAWAQKLKAIRYRPDKQGFEWIQFRESSNRSGLGQVWALAWEAARAGLKGPAHAALSFHVRETFIFPRKLYQTKFVAIQLQYKLHTARQHALTKQHKMYHRGEVLTDSRNEAGQPYSKTQLRSKHLSVFLVKWCFKKMLRQPDRICILTFLA